MIGRRITGHLAREHSMGQALEGIRVIDITRSFDAVRMWTPKFPT